MNRPKSLLASLPSAIPIWAVSLAVVAGLSVVSLAGMELRWVVYTTLALVGLLVYLLAPTKERFLVTAFVLTLQIDIYIRLLYGVAGSTGFAFPLVVVMGSVLVIYLLATNNGKIRTFKLAGSAKWPIVGIFSMMLLSWLFTSEQFVGLTYILSMMEWYFLYCLMFNLIQSREDIERILKLLFLMLALQSIVYFVQSALGITFDMLGETIAQGEIPRPGGTVSSNPAGFASFINPILLIGITLLVMRRRPLDVPFLPVLVLIGTSAIALTFTRAAWAALALGFLVAAFLVYKRRLLNIWKTLAAVLFIAGLGVAMLPKLLVRIQSNYQGQDAFEERMGLIRIALNVIKHHPLVGVGPGAYESTYKNYLPPDIDQWLFVVHNEFLLRAAEMGILGAVAFVLLLFGTFRCGLRLSRARLPSIQGIGIGWCAGVVALAWQMFWVPWTGFSYNAMLWLMLGFIDGIDRLLREGKLNNFLTTTK